MLLGLGLFLKGQKMVGWKTLISTIALSFVVSSCSTTREEVKESTLEATVPLPDNAVADESLTVENIALKNELQKNKVKITQLEQQISANNSKLSELNRQLNEQESKLITLTEQYAESNATLLKTLENERALRNTLEKNYLSLKLKNAGLQEDLNSLKGENQKLNRQIEGVSNTTEVVIKEYECSVPQASELNDATPIELVSTIQTEQTQNIQAPIEQNQAEVINEHCQSEDTTSTEYENVLNLQALNNEYAQTVLELGEKQSELTTQYENLNKRHQALEETHSLLRKKNSNLKESYAALKQKNLDLGGAIADSRAQHQILWDRISVQDKIIADLQASANSQTKEPTFQLSNASSSNDESVKSIPAVIESSAERETLQADSSELQAEIAQLKRELAKQQSLFNEFKQESQALFAEKAEKEVAKEQLARLQRDLEKLSEINQNVELALASVRAELDLSKMKESKLNQELDNLKSQLPKVRAELEALEKRETTLLAEKDALEKQINALIPFEAEVNALENQLKSNIKNVQWQRPTAMPLNSAFEVIVTAEVENVVSGQVYVAELVVDTSFDLISATEAESTVEDGKLVWRWRISGLNEQRAARVDLFVHQQIQYHDQRFSRQVYRDQTLVTLENDDFWEEYGFWGLAILAGLLGGFFVGRIGKGKE